VVFAYEGEEEAASFGFERSIRELRDSQDGAEWLNGGQTVSWQACVETCLAFSSEGAYF